MAEPEHLLPLLNASHLGCVMVSVAALFINSLGALPLAVFLLGWILFASFTSNGNPDPLPYVPLLNPLDLAQFGALLALATWYVLVWRMEIPAAKLPAISTALTLLGIVLFIALNGVLLRTLNHYAGSRTAQKNPPITPMV